MVFHDSAHFLPCGGHPAGDRIGGCKPETGGRRTVFDSHPRFPARDEIVIESRLPVGEHHDVVTRLLRIKVAPEAAVSGRGSAPVRVLPQLRGSYPPRDT